MRNTHRILLAAASCLILAACAGADGKDGTNGTNGANGTNGTNGANGVNGTNGTNGVNGVAGKLRLTIDSVVTEADKSKSTLTFTVYPAANVCPGAICDDTLSAAVVGTKTFYAQEYNAATKDFDTAKNISFGSVHFKGFSADGNGATYTATKTSPTWAPEASTSAFVYAYVTGLAAVPVPSTGHYLLPTSVASASKVYGAVPYTSSANASGCEKCHGAPYAKHGYRMANVAGLNEMVACKACHTDQRPGSDANWYMIADDPANYVANVLPSGSLAPAFASKYAYTANLMNDTHNSHAFEFNYPQSMANCVTCHAGKLASITTDENFKPTVCKSCHPVNGPAPTDAGANGGVEAGRAPSLAAIFIKTGQTATHASIDLYHSVDGGVDVTAGQCNTCHKAGGIAKTFAQIHSGLDDQIYFDGGTRWSDVVKTTIGATAWDPATKILTVPFTVTGAAANAVITPTVVGGLYGWGTKDFVVSGHGTAADGGRALEYTEGATNNHPHLTVSPAVSTAGNTAWTATANLSDWVTLPDGGPGLLSDGTVQRVQISVLPTLGINQAVAAGTTNPQVSITGATATITLVQNGTYAPGSVDPTGYGQDIVDSKKCNACHDRLATTFHGPNYGSAGVLACRTCHWAGAAGSHLEMQSRSIDSYVHAIHRMQYFDVGTVAFNDKVQALRYGDHTEGNYPNFAGPLNCESCHNAGKYNPPAQNRSLPGLISGAATLKAGSPARTIGVIPTQITGPAERACGGCHRAVLINEDDASGLAVFYAHTTVNGTTVLDTTQASLDNVDRYIMGQVGVLRPAPAAVAGAQVESCALCHGNTGDHHQELFNTWKNGLQK